MVILIIKILKGTAKHDDSEVENVKYMHPLSLYLTKHMAVNLNYFGYLARKAF